MESSDPTETQSYQYAALKADEIRLLRILPGSDKDLVSCTLEHFSLTTLPKYHALSYVWGVDINPSPILIHGCPSSITSNLHAALWQFRRSWTSISTSDEDSTDLWWIWIDALCINQADYPERAAQIQLMASIYKQSYVLIIWLGPEDTTSRDAFSALARYRDAYFHSRDDGVDTFDQFTKISKEEWLALGDLCMNPYFSRCWVLQEYILGGDSSTMFCCGSDSTLWLIEFLAEIMSKQGEVTAEPSRHPMCSWVARKRLIVFSDTYNYFISHNEDQDQEHSSGQQDEILLGLVLLQGSQEATNPRDKIYSILGLARELGVPEGSYDDLLVDYTASVEDVFSSYVQVVAQSSKRLNILGAACNVRQSAHVKRSWTPDWTQEILHNTRSVVQFSLSQNLKQKASLDVDCVCSFAKDLSTLTVRGFSLGMVSYIPPLDVVFEIARDFEERIRTAVSTLNQHSRTIEQNPWTTLASFLLADSWSWKEDIPPEVAVNKRKSWSIRLEGWFNPSHPAYIENKPHDMFYLKSGWHEKQDLTPTAVATLCDDEMITNALNKMFTPKGYGEGRFMAENGHIGRCDLHVQYWDDAPTASTVRVGDLLCIILGCANPLILRPMGTDQFELISEAWVPSVMYGEAMEELNVGQWKLQDFELGDKMRGRWGGALDFSNFDSS